MKLKILLATAALAGVLAASSANAATCVGNCGSLGADGDVSAPPNGSSYRWISTFGGADGVGQIADVGGTNGSMFISSVFTANAGDLLQFYFDYVSSDGQQADGTNYEDYTWAQLQTDSGAPVAMLFTARTEPVGNIAPGSGLPGVSADLNPASVTITPGAPTWSPLGGSTGQCWGPGCGSTGWIRSNYNIAGSGSYRLVLGVTNFVDTAYDSGLAFNGLTIAGTVIDDDGTGDDHGHDPVPEPSTWMMMILGFGLVGLAARRRTRLSVVSGL
jgi:hypothetical protein